MPNELSIPEYLTIVHMTQVSPCYSVINQCKIITYLAIGEVRMCADDGLVIEREIVGSSLVNPHLAIEDLVEKSRNLSNGKSA